MRIDITDTAICIARELYELDKNEEGIPDEELEALTGETSIRDALIGGDIGYCAERERIAELATVFDTAYDNLTPDIANGLDPWDMDMVPYLLHCAAGWEEVTEALVIQALADWVALDHIETAKRIAREK